MFRSVSEVGLKLTKTNHPAKQSVGEKLRTLEAKMQMLKMYTEARRHRLDEALEAHQVKLNAIFTFSGLFYSLFSYIALYAAAGYHCQEGFLSSKKDRLIFLSFEYVYPFTYFVKLGFVRGIFVCHSE